ncbi:hypothetical protein E2320_022534 [Naja naja]|nr:hypothetical protein E2320_022534 [Naja naja]
MFLAGTLGVWNDEYNRFHAFFMSMAVCLEENGVFFLCGGNMSVVAGEQALPVPLIGHVQKSAHSDPTFSDPTFSDPGERYSSWDRGGWPISSYSAV